MAKPATHPNEETLNDFVTGRLAEGERSQVERHIAGCDACCQTLAAVRSDTLELLAREAVNDESPVATGVGDATPAELTDHPRYRILGRLGEGGMGVVYKAEHRLMQRTVALKVIHRRMVANPAAVERFRREVTTAARLVHPNIVTAHDAEETAGLHFLVMEYIEGTDLARLVAKKGPLPPAWVAKVGKQVAQGLKYAADRGMVHRDIKPHNVMVTKNGQVKVLDFGLARFAAEPVPLAADDTLAKRMETTASLVVGTPDFLAPEQAINAREVDHRADLYGLGCTLYYLLTGQVPFPGGSAVEKLLRHHGEPTPDVRILRHDCPESLARVISRLMAKRPEDRYAGPAEVAEALDPPAESVLPAVVEPKPNEGKQPAASPRQRRRGRKPRWPLVVAGGAICVLFLGLSYAFWPDSNKGRAGDPGDNGGHPSLTAGSTAKQRTVLFAIPQGGLWYEDYVPVKERLERRGVKVVPMSAYAGKCNLAPTSTGPLPIVTTRGLSEALAPDEFDGVLFAGYNVDEFVRPGPARDNLRMVIDHCRRNRKPIGAICTGQKTLAGLGLLKGGVPVAANKYVQQECPDSGARPVYQNLVKDANSGIVTAAEPKDAGLFADAICQLLGIR